MTDDTLVQWKTLVNMLGTGIITALVALLLVMFFPLPGLPSWAPILLGVAVSFLYYSYEEYGREEVTTS
ncbi:MULTISPECIES: hypothetical protein [unclassified Haladaptatus]|uniref:hypothetical protein n=1 Tax=unclassified Haladaptatus TaxID=2622732 RepID=UPI00209C1CE4|nr:MULTISPECIES: hypothetical protein [unclassified Haladaptatus]MCO8245868.1 hypothetical protein [Haladaptatus sp. AB643]MCO8254512.1 hypothetical protein [Haladaptatus sp. AB618]